MARIRRGEIVKCAVCGKGVYVRPSQLGRKRTCSKACGYALHAAEMRGRLYEKTCSGCGQRMMAGPNRKLCAVCGSIKCSWCGGAVKQVGVTRARKYCSVSCRDAAKAGKPIRGGKVIASCAACGERVFVFACRAKKRNYCSTVCAALGIAKHCRSFAKSRYENVAERRDASNRTKAAWADPVKKKRHSSALRTQAYRALRSKISTAKFKDPVIRARLSAALRSSQKHKDAMIKRGVPKCPNWQEYSGHKFRSKWERDFAQWADSCGLRWEYEPKRFILSNGDQYTPDFLAHTASGPCYVELHRILSIRPGDEKKIAKLYQARGELNYPLILLGERDVYAMRKYLKAFVRKENQHGEPQGE